MCSYLGAEMVSLDTAKPRSSSKPAFLATGIAALMALFVLAGCNGVTVDLGSNVPGGKLSGNDTPAVEEVTWIDVTADELIANYPNYLGKEVYLRNTIIVSKSVPFITIGGGKIKAEPTDQTLLNYLAISDTVEARGVVAGLDESGAVIIEEAHINVWFSCYPREHTGNDDVGNDTTVQSDTNGVSGYGTPGA